MNVKKCTVCDMEIDEDKCKKNRNICKECYNINRKKYNNNRKKRKNDDSMNNIEKPKIDKINNNNVSTYEIRANVVIGPKNVGKSCYKLKVIEKIDNKRPIHIIT